MKYEEMRNHGTILSMSYYASGTFPPTVANGIARTLPQPSTAIAAWYRLAVPQSSVTP